MHTLTKMKTNYITFFAFFRMASHSSKQIATVTIISAAHFSKPGKLVFQLLRL